MAAELTNEIIEAIKDKDSIKVVATVDGRGFPHVVAKGSLNIDDEGRLYFWELLESSVTNRNTIHALWFNKWIAVNIITKDKKSYQIKGYPYKTLVNGKEYQKAYVKALERNPENDLAAVYFIRPEEVINESYPVRKAEENLKHPLYIHLDHYAYD